MKYRISNTTISQAQAGDTAAAEAVVNNMQPAVAAWAKQIAGVYATEDATLEGMGALWQAVVTFDSSQGASFYTWARQVVRIAIYDMVANNNDGPSVHERTSRRYFALVKEAGDDIDKAAAMTGGDDTNISTATFWAAHRALDATERLDIEVCDPARHSALDEASQRSTTDVAETATDNVVVSQMLDGCTDRERAILERTYGINGQPEQKDADIAATLGISRPRVVTIRKAAISRLAETNN